MAAITDPLILPADVVLVAVAELPEGVRQRLEYEEGDIAVTRPRSRVPSKIIDTAAAELLGEFRSATTIVDAMLRYSSARESDPREVLENAFPLIQQLVNSQLLVPAGSPEAEQIQTATAPGEQIGNFQTIRCIQVLQDTELHQARHRDGALVALKVARSGDSPEVARMLDREAEVLRHLDGRVNPELVAQGQFDDRTFLAMTWCAGVPASVAAGELRGERTTSSRSDLLALCVSILDAFANLHAQSVIHGDIHPNNILVDAAGKIQIIDFGLARVLDEERDQPDPQRGGVAFFFEPEYANACREGRRPPPAQALGEQYSLAALVYNLLTGAQYIDFSLEQNEMLRQIAMDEMLPFVDNSIQSWPLVEQVIARALSKDPTNRFKDVAEFASQLAAADESIGDVGHIELIRSLSLPDDSDHAFLSEVLTRVGFDGPLIGPGLPIGPTASVNYGAAGIAHTLYRVANLRGDPSLLALADVWAMKAEHDIAEESGSYNPDIEITPETVGHVSPFHTASGVHAVQALIGQSMGDRASQHMALRSFVAAVDGPCDNLDLSLGRPGLLLAGSLLFEAMPEPSEENHILGLGQTTLQHIWAEIDSYPQIEEAVDFSTLGMAHGWAGVMFATLRWCQATGSEVPSPLKDRLAQTAGCAEYIGRGARWPWHLTSHSSNFMSGWCNGSAGYVFLWTLAYRMLKDERYLMLAEWAAWNSWEDSSQVANLCCGLAGRAYALLNIYKCTDNRAWLDKAHRLAQSARVNIRSLPIAEYEGYENSLYKGELGVAALIADLDSPQRSAMPFFEAEGWPS